MRVAIALDFRDFVGQILWTGRRAMDDDEDRPLDFRDKVGELFPDAQSSRLARQFDVKQRTAQKWLAGELPIPEEITTWVDEQYAAVARSLRVMVMESLIQQWSDAGIDDSVIAAHISRIYGDLTGMQIR